MKLLLTSAGITNSFIEQALKKLVGEEIKFAFIPTAANVEKGDKDWLIDNYLECKRLGYVDIIDISTLPMDVCLNRIAECNVIVVGGGNTSYLMEQCVGSGFDKELLELLKTKVYVGISAGSIILSKTLWVSSEFLYGDESNEVIAGLGVVNFNFRPHYNSEHFPKVRKTILEELSKNNPEEVIYACDDDTAVLVVDDGVEVISEGAWDLFP